MTPPVTEASTEASTEPPTEPSIALILLAAGRSSRMQGRHKLLEDTGGEPMVHRSARTALDSGLGPVVVVTGFQANRVAAALHGLPLTCIEAPDYADGLSASLRAGLRACPPDCAGAMILLADMPDVTAADLRAVYDGWRQAPAPAIAVAARAGQRGNPVLWDRAYFAELCAVSGDTGGREVLHRHADRVRKVERPGDAIFTDVDTPEDLAALRRRLTTP